MRGNGKIIYGIFKVKKHRSHISSRRAKVRGWRRPIYHRPKRNYKRKEVNNGTTKNARDK
jgi:hypothetical protein